MGPEPRSSLTAREHAEAVRARGLTAREGIESTLARIAAAEPSLGAFTQVLAASARAEADAFDALPVDDPRRSGALAGVPVAVKAEIDVAGQVTSVGGFGNSTPAVTDAEVVRRLRAAGAIVVGITNMPEFGQFPFTESARYGTTVNPWDPTRSPGGSSGGSAAAVAAGLVPLALGGDGGGSIRIPASCCGLFGLKPRRGRVSAAPHPDLWGSLGTAGVLSRTVADSALAYDAIAGVTPFDRWRAPALGRSFAEAAATEPGRMRIGWTTRPAVAGIPVDTQVAAAVRRTAVRLEDLGHQVDELDRPLPSQVAAFIPQLYAALREEAGRVEHPDRLEALTRAGIRLGALVTPGVLARALRAAGSLTERVDGLLASYDVLLTPTLACLPPPLGRLDGVGHTVATLRATPMAAFTSLFNVTGHPAASVPAGLSREGWPIGVQLAAANEDTIMSLAAQLETDQPWPSPA